jgi:hypothetical protein
VVAELSGIQEKVAEPSELNSNREKQVLDLLKKLHKTQGRLEHQALLSTDDDANNLTPQAANKEL